MRRLRAGRRTASANHQLGEPVEEDETHLFPVPGGPVRRKPLGVSSSSRPSCALSTLTSSVVFCFSLRSDSDRRSASSSGDRPMPRFDNGERLNGHAGRDEVVATAEVDEEGGELMARIDSRRVRRCTGGW